ncbi:MAG: gamma-glutamyltransferase [Calditrichaeota bacterium]|nr:gamma-glutamyltransferase [Calditrichota bacterium]MCB9367838.1 gamma-glutamyltransferase [Calditrichota bacterium]
MIRIGFLGLLLYGCASTTPPATELTPPEAPVDTNFARALSASFDSGIVVCAHPLAAAAGKKVLASGGNAMDAALAALATLNVVEPHASGLGGGGFALYYDASGDSVYMLDYRERAPARMKRDIYFQPDDTLKLVQRSGGTSVLVPGAAAGWQQLHRRFGTRTMPELFADAIAIADTGYTISEKQAAIIFDHAEELMEDSAMSRIFLEDGLPPSAGFRITQPKLGQLLSFLSSTRLENFYFPPYSTEVANAIRAHGGQVTDSDLNAYKPVERKPLRMKYRDYDIITTSPPAGGGLIMLETLKLLEAYDIQKLGLLTPEYIHTVSMAIRQARTDAADWLGDPDFARIPVDTMLSPAYLAEVRDSMSMDSVPKRLTALDSIRAFGPGNTTHLVVADKDGNLVTLTQSINYFFGSGVMVPELGLLLNNHCADFQSDTTGPNPIAPLHRPVSSMAPTIILKDGNPVLIIGTPGGPRIPAAMVEVILAVLEFDVPLNEALDLPRFFPAGTYLVYETRIPQETMDALAAKGWKPYPNEPLSNYFGGVQAIHFPKNSPQMVGSSDPRRDGAADGY